MAGTIPGSSVCDRSVEGTKVAMRTPAQMDVHPHDHSGSPNLDPSNGQYDPGGPGVARRVTEHSGVPTAQSLR